MSEPRTFDVRLEVADTPMTWQDVYAFLADAQQLAEERHRGIEVRYVQERRDRRGRPRRQRRPEAA